MIRVIGRSLYKIINSVGNTSIKAQKISVKNDLVRQRGEFKWIFKIDIGGLFPVL